MEIIYSEFEIFALSKIFDRHVSTIKRWIEAKDDRLTLPKALKAMKQANIFENALYEIQSV